MTPYRIVDSLIRLCVGFYFARVERFGLDRIPAEGPLLLASNHPNSLADAFVIGASVPRRVHFLATVQLFKLKPVAWLLHQCGVIPVNRVKDDPAKMRSVMDSFEAVFRVLESRGAVCIFPEGITHDDPQVKAVKTGAARIALELEHRHGGKLGLTLVPVGLNYSAKERYRSDLLAHFGEPIRPADFLPGYEERRRERIQELTDRLESSLQSLVLHLSELEDARVVEAVRRLYLERLKLGNLVVQEPMLPRAEELALTRAIADAVRYFRVRHPDRLVAFARRLSIYERWLERLGLSDRAVSRLSPDGSRSPIPSSRSLAWAAAAVLGAPVAAYGWVHRLLPLLLVRGAVARYANVGMHKAQIGTTAMVAGVLAFGLFYGALVLAVHLAFGWPASLWYGLSLPVAGLAAHYYLRETRRLAQGLAEGLVLLRLKAGARRMARLRRALISEIDTLRAEYRSHAFPGA